MNIYNGTIVKVPGIIMVANIRLNKVSRAQNWYLPNKNPVAADVRRVVKVLAVANINEFAKALPK
jgi:hypothetical protein